MDDDAWNDLRERCEKLEPGAELVTPVSERRFAVGATFGDRILVRFRDGGEERSLRREQFEALADRLADEAIPIPSLTPGVEPYAAVLSLSGTYAVDGDEIVREPDAGVGGESPSLVPPEEARTRPERVRDDALLLSALLGRLDATEPASIETADLVDLYVLLSDVQRGADRLRGEASDPLLDRLGPDQRLSGRYGTVHRTTRRYRHPKDEETVLDTLDERDIPREWVLGIDPDKLDVVVTVTDVDPDEVYDVDEQSYVQKTGVDEREKYSRLRGLFDTGDELEDEDLREDVEDLERRLDDALSA